MNDTFNIPNNELKTQVFYTTAIGISQWQTWTKPANAKLIFFTVIGGGGGGAGGTVGILTGGRAGGGGGGGSSITRGLFPASILPDTLYIQVGVGGAGGAGMVSGGQNGAGGAGGLSYVSMSANTDFANIVLASGTAAATGGVGNSTNGGTAGTAFLVTNSIIGRIGLFTSTAGQIGANGATGAIGANITPANLPITGGASGGGAGSSVSYSGGSINAFAFVPKLHGGASGSTGSDGYEIDLVYNNMTNSDILFFTGGAGGGGLFNGGGGNGGHGGYGSGGGGGGAGFVTGFSGGTGGTGGDGVIIITCL
jgi:hypothetical protein